MKRCGYIPAGAVIEQLPADEKWLYLLANAAEVEPEFVVDQLSEAAYREVLGVLVVISKSPEKLQSYEDQLKFLRDEPAKLDAAGLQGLQE